MVAEEDAGRPGGDEQDGRPGSEESHAIIVRDDGDPSLLPFAGREPYEMRQRADTPISREDRKMRKGERAREDNMFESTAIR